MKHLKSKISAQESKNELKKITQQYKGLFDFD